jgi:hypothetical protein
MQENQILNIKKRKEHKLDFKKYSDPLQKKIIFSRKIEILI